MSAYDHRHYKPGNRCDHHGHYRVYKLTRTGLAPTRYRREVGNPSRFPPTPGKGEVFILEKSYESEVVVQLPLFPYGPWGDEDEGTLPMVA